MKFLSAVMKLLPGSIVHRVKQFMINRYRNKISSMSVEEVFTFIYKNKIWGGSFNRSGTGSTDDLTQEIIKELPILLKKYDIQSILDLPCGDFSWLQNIDLSGYKYIGGDIVQELIDANNQKFSNKNITFKKINLIEDTLPQIDLLLCRDCLNHLSLKHIHQVLLNISNSKIKYLLVTSMYNHAINSDIIDGEWRPVNFEIAPYYLNAIDFIDEKCPLPGAEKWGKRLILIDVRKMKKSLV